VQLFDLDRHIRLIFADGMTVADGFKKIPHGVILAAINPIAETDPNGASFSRRF
jgi:hypothetical protein